MPVQPAPPAQPETTTTTVAPASPAPPEGQDKPGRQPRKSRPTTTTAPPTTTSTASPSRDDGQGGSDQVQTISSQGGTVAVRYLSGDRVKLLWARPNAGFAVEVVSDGTRLVHVRFNNDRHRSTVTAWWRDGTPAQFVQESDVDGGRYKTQNWQWWSR